MIHGGEMQLWLTRSSLDHEVLVKPHSGRSTLNCNEKEDKVRVTRMDRGNVLLMWIKSPS
jgi:hypothetical protein